MTTFEAAEREDREYWRSRSPDNAAKLVRLIREFGFNVPELSEDLFLHKGRIIRMGVEPTRIELQDSKWPSQRPRRRAKADVTRNISTTAQVDRLVDSWPREGRFANRSEVCRAGMCER